MSYGLLRRWSRAARSSIIERAPGPARRTFALGDLERGWVVRDRQGRVALRMPEGCFYFEPVLAPLAEVSQPSDLDAYAEMIEAFDWPAFADESLEKHAERAKRLFEETEWAVVANPALHLLAVNVIRNVWPLARRFQYFIIITNQFQSSLRQINAFVIEIAIGIRPAAD